MEAQNKGVALITGSTSGIGAATAELFGQSGYHVIVTGRNRDRGEAVCQRILDAQGSADFFAADLTQQAGAEELAGHAAKLGELTILVNCAGGNKPGSSFDDLFAINYKATVFATRAALRHMKAGSCIINVTSVCSESKQAHERGAYSDAKAAATSFTYGLAKDLAQQDIRIHIVAPGLTDTADTVHIPKDDRNALIERMPLTDSFLNPSDVARTIYDLSTWRQATGQTVVVDGGMTAMHG